MNKKEVIETINSTVKQYSHFSKCEARDGNKEWDIKINNQEVGEFEFNDDLTLISILVDNINVCTIEKIADNEYKEF